MKRTVTRQRGQSGYTPLLVAILLMWAVQAALIVGVIYVAIHFLLKVW